MVIGDKGKLLQIHLSGIAQVFGLVMIASLLILWTLQALALTHGVTADWQAVLRHLFLSISFLAFFPGQEIWTYRITDRSGRVHTIIGKPLKAQTRRD